MRFSIKSSALALVFAFLSGLIGGVVGSWGFVSYQVANLDVDGGDTILNFDNISYTQAWEEAAPAVVSVVALKDLSEYYNQFSFNPFGFEPASQATGELEQVSSGTAFIITPDGLAVTNKHVVEDTEAEYVVVLEDGTELDAEVLDRDSLNDIALLQIQGDDERIGDLPHLDFADSDEVNIGEPVLAIGNALGEYSNTTTAGIISATGRQIVAASGYGSVESLVGLFQTDAAINSGNSGGPLVNLNGEVVGMNTAVQTNAAGIGFAIPSNDIALVVTSYQEYGRIVRPFLGVRYVVVTEGIKKRFKLDVDYGALLVGDLQSGQFAVVSGSSADKAGLKEGDVILSLEGEEINESYSLSNAIAGHAVGETVRLEVWRDGETIQVDVTLEEQED